MQGNTYRATKIGAIFTGVCIALAYTYLVPIFVVLPGVMFYEELAKALAPSHHLGKVTIALLSLTVLVCIVPMLYSAWRVARNACAMRKAEIVAYMALLCFIVHPLGFYVYWWLKYGFHMDGQIIFASADSFPYSSLFFVVFGFVLDTVANYTMVKANA